MSSPDLTARSSTTGHLAPIDGAGGDVEAAPPSQCEQFKESGQTIWVEWEHNDKENPQNFSKAKKWMITVLLVFLTAEVASTASAYVPGIPSMEADLSVSNHELSLLGISLYALGFGIPPLLLAPISEVFGRSPVYIITHIIYQVMFLGIGFARNMPTVLVLRFIQGMCGSSGSTLVGGSIADIWSSAERGTPMALFATAAIFGTGVGPVWAGWVELNKHLQWRFINHIQAAYTCISLVGLVFFLKETRGSVILTRRAQKLRRSTGNPHYKARAEEERASLAVLMKVSLSRPLWLLVSEPIVTAFSIWISLQWGVMYSLLSTIGLITAQHGYNSGQTGLVFIAICVAALIGQATQPIQERLYSRNFAKRGPEARLYFACIGAFLFPIGCFIYAWTSYPHISIAGPIVGIIVLMTGVYTIYLCVFLYLSDAYLIYASSALAAQSFLRNVFGCVFPLFSTQMYQNLSYEWASTLVGLLGLVLGVVPFILMWKGPSIRARSRFAQALLKQQAEQEKRTQA